MEDIEHAKKQLTQAIQAYNRKYGTVDVRKKLEEMLNMEQTNLTPEETERILSDFDKKREVQVQGNRVNINRVVEILELIYARRGTPIKITLIPKTEEELQHDREERERLEREQKEQEELRKQQRRSRKKAKPTDDSNPRGNRTDSLGL